MSATETVSVATGRARATRPAHSARVQTLAQSLGSHSARVQTLAQSLGRAAG